MKVLRMGVFTERLEKKVLKKYCKKPFDNDEIKELIDIWLCFFRASVNGEYAFKRSPQWFGILVAILEEHECKNVKKALSIICELMFDDAEHEIQEAMLSLYEGMKRIEKEEEQNGNLEKSTL